MKSNKIEAKKKFIVGSTSFFECYDDFKSKDLDELWILEEPFFGKNKSMLMKTKGKDIILYPPFSKDEFIEHDLTANDSMKFGKYLTNEFVDYNNITIDDLKKLKPLVNKLNDKHQYQKIIYDAYVENNGFFLTDEQRLKAYDSYKKSRR